MSDYPSIRCPACRARLFDTSGREADSPDGHEAPVLHIEVHIKCWRCGDIVKVRLIAPGIVREVINGPMRKARAA
jgi:hypothetical protein